MVKNIIDKDVSLVFSEDLSEMKDGTYCYYNLLLLYIQNLQENNTLKFL